VQKGVLLVAMALGLSPLAACAPQQTAAVDPLTFMQAPMEASGLVGSTPQILNAEFGKPTLRRVDGPAQVWLYHAAGCGLNLILYPDSSGTPRVTMATATADSSVPDQCTTSLQRAHVDAALEHPSAS
jgi:hypothetical protein